MTRAYDYEELPLREKIVRPRGAKPSVREAQAWDSKRSKKKGIDRTSKVRYYADLEA